MTRPRDTGKIRPGIDAPLDVLETGVVTTIGDMDAAVAARILAPLELMRDMTRMLADSPGLFDVHGGRDLPGACLAIMVPDEPFTATLLDPATGCMPPDRPYLMEQAGIQNRYVLHYGSPKAGFPPNKAISLTIVDAIAHDGVSHAPDAPDRPRVTPTTAALADVLDLAVRVCTRIAEDDRIIDRIDMAAIDTALRDLVTMPGGGAEAVTLASPWSDVHGIPEGTHALDAGHPLDAVDPASVSRMRAAMDRHWMLRHRVPLIGMGLTGDMVSIGMMTRGRKDRRFAVAGEPKGIDRLRRHHHDAELHARIAGWGCCPPPGDQA